MIWNMIKSPEGLMLMVCGIMILYYYIRRDTYREAKRRDREECEKSRGS